MPNIASVSCIVKVERYSRKQCSDTLVLNAMLHAGSIFAGKLPYRINTVDTLYRYICSA